MAAISKLYLHFVQIYIHNWILRISIVHPLWVPFPFLEVSLNNQSYYLQSFFVDTSQKKRVEGTYIILMLVIVVNVYLSDEPLLRRMEQDRALLPELNKYKNGDLGHVVHIGRRYDYFRPIMKRRRYPCWRTLSAE